MRDLQKERERDWIERALRDSESKLNLSRYLKVAPDDVPREFFRVVYEAARLRLFHAKHGLNFIAPQPIDTDRTELAKTLRTLTHIVLRMFEVWGGVRRVGGWVSASWIHRSVVRTWEGARVVVSDLAVMDPAEQDLSHPRFAVASCMQNVTVRQVVAEPPSIEADVPIEDLAAPQNIRRFDIIGAEHPMMAHVVEDVLDVRGFERCEFVARVRVQNNNQPRTTGHW